MSVDEDTELRDLVAQTLESNGVLGKIRAQLRANVFLALEEQDAAKNKPPYDNPDLKKFIGTKEGQAVTSLVREFLQFFDLEYTLVVFDPEVGIGDNYESRTNLAREYNIIESSDSESKKAPLLAEIVKRGAGGSTVARGRTSSTTEDLGLKHLQEARMKFDTYDKDKNGSIDKDELRALFADMFPSFHKNMLERYVNDEFRAVDMDFSNTIDFEEFLDMYKRLFVLCKSVVSHDVSDIVMASPRRMSDTPSKIPAIKKTKSIDEEDETNSLEKNRPGNLADIDEKRTPKGLQDALSDQDDDSFFDDPVPDNSKTKEILGDVNAGKPSSPRVSHIPVRSPRADQHSTKPETKSSGVTGMSSLAGLPSLTGGSQNNESTTPRMPDIGSDDLADLDKQNGHDDDYDEDFESSNLIGVKFPSQLISPMGATPRSARSDHNLKSIDDDEIEEDIQEDISIVDDFLKSDNSGMDDLTTDRTVSPTDQSTAFDYVEEVLS